MGIVRDILKATARRILADERSFYGATVTTGDVAGQDRGHRSRLQQVVLRNHSWVWRCANINAEAVAAVPLRVYRRKKTGEKWAWRSAKVDRFRMQHLRKNAGGYAVKMVAGMDEVEEITDFDHPLVSVLVSANPEMNGFEFIYAMSISYELCGVGYCYHVDQGRVPVQLWPLQPQYVRAVPSKGNLVERYEYGRSDEVEETYTPGQVFPYKSWSIHDPFHGYGPLMAILPDADLTESITEFRRSVLDRACQPGLIVTGNFGGEEKRKAMEAALNAKHAGSRKAGRSLVMDINPDKIKVDKWEPGGDKTLGYITDEAQLRDKVAAIFGVPRAMLTAEDLNLANVKTGIPLHQLLAVRPRCRRLEDTLNERLVPLFGDENLFVAFDNPVDQDEAAQSAMAVAEYAGGLRTRNEARAVRMLEPVPDGDEFSDREAAGNAMAQLEASARLMPDMGGDEEEDEDGKPKPGDKPEMGPGDGGKSAAALPAGGNVRAVPEAARGPAVGAVKATDALFHACAGSCCTHRPRTGRDRTKDDRRDEATDRAERNLERTLRAWFMGVFNPMLAWEPGPGGFERAQFTEHIQLTLSLPSVRDSFIREVGPELTDVFAAGYDDGVDLLGARRPPSLGVFAVTNEPAVRFLDTYRVRLSQSVTQTAIDRITGAIQAGVENADSIPMLKERVKAEMQGISDVGAERIARTEAARAYLHGRETAWVQSGVVVGKEWLLSADPCEVCQALATKANGKREIGQPFLGRGEPLALADGTTYTNDYETMDTPPAHPQCRCSLGAVFSEEVTG
jgi:HK97 family phage portal protein